MMLDQLRRLLVSFDAFDEPFHACVESRLLLFPTDGFLLSRAQYEALSRTARLFGDQIGHCLITEDVAIDTEQVNLKDYRFQLESYDGYMKLSHSGCILQENVLLPESGSWVVLFSQEFHALLGCSQLFASEFTRLYSRSHSDLAAFIDAWKSNAERIGSDISWLPRLVRHMTLVE